ncbi:transcriptional regulator [Qipengyuania sp. JC766]|uniref:transcriptional regulator n=1 Tax=Qipengyuania sp. JC766 TaxID=3232139 RepID=UPI00345AB7AD
MQHLDGEPLHDEIAFDEDARALFARNYPEVPHRLTHGLSLRSEMQLDALAELAERLPENSIEYNRGDVPIGVDGKPGSTGRSIGETIRAIATSNSWAVLKNIEQDPEYAALLHALLGELAPQIEATTGELLTPQGFIFISSPNAVTPYHFDPEHNILLQLKGTKVMTQFPAGDARFAPDRVHESYHLGGARELVWDDAFLSDGREFPLGPGQAVYVPVMAPHFVRNGPGSSISLSITWRSNWSYDEAGARCFNAILRQAGMNPNPPHRWPGSNRWKRLGFRAWRKVFGPPSPS